MTNNKKILRLILNARQPEQINKNINMISETSLDKKSYCGGWDSNPRLSGYEPDFLTTELPRDI